MVYFSAVRPCVSVEVLSCVDINHFYRNHSWVLFQGFAESLNAALNILLKKVTLILVTFGVNDSNIKFLPIHWCSRLFSTRGSKALKKFIVIHASELCSI